MGFDHSSSPGGTDLGFAFNNSDFSDRVLRIEIVSEDPPESENSQTLTDCGAARKSKRRRGDVVDQENGDEAPPSRSSDEDGSSVMRVETFRVNSLLLASNSPFFYKLFSNGMLESKKKCVTLRIDASEEAALMELLNFMYSGTLRVNTASAVSDVLIVADKFEVASCMSHCCGFLRDTAMTLESALLYLELPTRSEAVKPLMDAANQFLVARYKDISKHEDEVMDLPLVGIEAILSSDDLQVPSEDKIYDIALMWAEIHYQKHEERRDILCNRLICYIRFPYMSLEKLREALTCDYLDKDLATKAVLDAMLFKSDNSPNHLFAERAYMHRPIRVLKFELPRQHSVVYLDLKREECVGMFQSDRIFSQTFVLGGRESFFTAQYTWPSQSFGLVICVEEKEKDSATFAFNCLVSARSKPSEEYTTMCKKNCDLGPGDLYITMCKKDYGLTPGNAADGNVVYQFRFLFSIPWTLFVANDSPYFINEVFQIRAEITVKH